ncbi:MGMT family protein [uncultured Proteiniphilum sp.]
MVKILFFWIVPCHRVVYTNGKFDRYSWGRDIKTRFLAWEFVNSKI